MKKLFIAGHRGMVGSALVREAELLGGFQLITATRDQLDLCNQGAVFDFLADEKPDIVIIAAAKVGGIHANSTYPADFIYENLAIASNLTVTTFRFRRNRTQPSLPANHVVIDRRNPFTCSGKSQLLTPS
jgi:hypothetical protein